MDLHYDHNTQIHALRASHAPDAPDLLAIAGEHSVDVLHVSHDAVSLLVSFHIGARLTALAWSPRTRSPSVSDAWFIELVAAGADFGLHLLTKGPAAPALVWPFGGGLSGHHGPVTDLVFAGGFDADSPRYLASVSDDATLIVWDLLPPDHSPTHSHSPAPAPAHNQDHSPPPPGSPPRAPSPGLSPTLSARPQPTAYPIPFPAPLASIRAHPATGKEFLVADAHGGVFLVDWRADPADSEGGALRHSSVVELFAPATLAAAAMGAVPSASASVDWRPDAIDLVGGVFGSQYALWDISKLRGGTPHISGRSFPDGVQQFRWCPTFTDYFAVSTNSPRGGAVVNVHNCAYAHAPPTPVTIRARPSFVRAFDFLALPGIPRIAAAVGASVVIFPIGVDV